MAYLTAEELFRLVISSSPPAEPKEEFDASIRTLKRIGHFSPGAQQVLHRMQGDQHFLAAIMTEPESVFEELRASLSDGEFLPLMVAALIIATGVPYTSDTAGVRWRTTPTREEAIRLFQGQMFDPKAVRHDTVQQVLAGINPQLDISTLLNNPRTLLLLFEEPNISDFLTVYFILCVKHARLHNSGVKDLTVPIPQPVLKAMQEPTSSQLLQNAIEYLFRDKD